MALKPKASLTSGATRKAAAFIGDDPTSDTLTATRFDNSPRFFGHAVAATIFAERFDGAPTFGSHLIFSGTSVLPARFNNMPSFGDHLITKTIFPSRFANTPRFFPLTLVSEDVEEAEAGTLRPVADAPINEGLAWCIGSHPSGSAFLGKDLVTGQGGSLLTSGALNGVNAPHGTWLCLQSTSTSDGGAYFPNTAALRAITNKRTIAFYGRLDSFAVHGKLISIPFFQGGWGHPYHSQALSRVADTAGIQAGFVVANALQTPQTTAGFTVGEHLFVVTLNGDTAQAIFYVDGVQVGGAQTINGGNIDWSTEPVTVMNRSNSSTGEGVDGLCYWAAIWGRVLSAAEVSSLAAAPLHMFHAGEDTPPIDPPPDPDPDPDPEPEPDPGEPPLPGITVNVTTSTTLATINAIPSNRLIQFANGTYNLGGAIVPKSGQYYRGNPSNPAAVVLNGGNYRAFTGSGAIAPGTVISGLTITNYQSGMGSAFTIQPTGVSQDAKAQIGTIEDAAGWQILDCRIVSNYCTGLRIHNGTRVARCTITDNGHVGILVGKDGSQNTRARDTTIEDCTIRNNGRFHMNPTWDSGGIKFVGGGSSPGGVSPAFKPARNNKVRRNKISENWGCGIWFDWDVISCEVYNNSIFRNHHSGINIEASGAMHIHHNQIGDNCISTSGFPNLISFRCNTVAIQNGKKNLIERNLFYVNRQNASVLLQHNRNSTSPLTPKGGIYMGWFTGTENIWQDNCWLMATNGAFTTQFSTHGCSNSNVNCTGVSCSQLCGTAATGCNISTTPGGETLGTDPPSWAPKTNFMCFIPQPGDNHFNIQRRETFRIASGTANRWTTGAFGSVSQITQLGNPTGFIPNWNTIPTWSKPPGSAGNDDLAPALFVNTPTFKTHLITETLTAARFDNSPTFGAHVISEGSGTGLFPARFNNSPVFKTHLVTETLTAARFDNSPTFKSHAITGGGTSPFIATQSGAGSKGWQQAGSPWNTSVTGFTSFAVGFNGRNAIRIDNVPIPAGATITSATIKFTSANNASGASNWQIRVEQDPDAAIIEAIARNIEDRNLGTSDFLWNSVPAWTAGQRDANTTTPSFHVQVQDRVIDAGGWAAGQAILITWRSNTTSGYREYATDEHATYAAPELTIAWTT